MNSNFPTGLAIFHSSYPSTSQFNFGSPDTHEEELADVLDPKAQDTAIAEYGIAGRVWEAAYAMMIYVRHPDSYEFDPCFSFGTEDIAVELGAGSGVAGLALAAAYPHSRVVLTDLPEVCPLLRTNARGYAGVWVRPLVWGCAAHAQALRDELGPVTISHIICSDLVYFPELFAPLLRSLLHLTTPTSPMADAQVIISYKIRSLSKETAFWSAFGLWFTLEPVLVRSRFEGRRWERFGTGGDGELIIFIARRRPESFSWTVPEDDMALSEGVGARGTLEKKSDEGFEMFLLMNVEI
ncbi:putative methyltransferase-domain-containing protein [Multifurca ochricompacta]|uniref:Methyltransferase-domain-containing protein n=1 Tax=Multifurca ochricompacta TaxID=376703 RepID=A0AAD4M8M5_9AGAM|nr:putative methyltransferase-domain-containing protein [Multifurca ochricompacta]